MMNSTNAVQLWDIAGVDGLQAMQALWGKQVTRIAPFQSLEAELDRISCSVLRLCEGNFRIRYSGERAALQARLETAVAGKQVWLKQFPWLGSIVLPAAIDLQTLSHIATAKPPFRLSSLALHCAAPARIEGISVLVWRHLLHDTDRLEIHTAQKDLYSIQSKLTIALSLSYF